MTQIAVKKSKKLSSTNTVPKKTKLNLCRKPAPPQPSFFTSLKTISASVGKHKGAADREPLKKKRPFLTKFSSKWRFIGIIIAALALGAAFGYLWRSRTVLVGPVLKDAVISGSINQRALYEQMLPFQSVVKEQNLYFQPAISKLNGYLRELGIDFGNDIQPLFKEEVGFVLQQDNSDTSFPFLLAFEAKTLVNPGEIMSKIQPILERDFDLSLENYRQIEVITLEPLYEPAAGLPKTYAYAYIEGRLLISNSWALLQTAIDRIVDK